MRAELMLKRSILTERGWELKDEAYAHPDRNYVITEQELMQMTLEQLKERIA